MDEYECPYCGGTKGVKVPGSEQVVRRSSKDEQHVRKVKYDCAKSDCAGFWYEPV